MHVEEVVVQLETLRGRDAWDASGWSVLVGRRTERDDLTPSSGSRTVSWG